MNSVRVRFAPSPTGPLHIGGLRTALYNYLFAKNHGGTFILRVEDTDQNRYVEGAEAYIRRALAWAGIEPEEGPEIGGEFGPYRQSERKEIYQKYILQLIDNGSAYYAFDTPAEIEEMKVRYKELGIHTPKYDHTSRMSMRNSLSLASEEVESLLASGTDYTIRLKVEPDRQVVFQDIIRDEVKFNSTELDDKVLMKSDGLPTYHLANIIDDYSMQISHVIRGEEWLSSTAHHVLLYQAFGWEKSMPQFAHLPLLLKPTGKGKLSKRDGQKLGIPVFPMDWQSDEGLYHGFKEMGFLPEAVINFLAFLGWNPGTEQEIFSLDELASVFSLDQVSKGGARFDFDKAKWYNQQYILAADSDELTKVLKKELDQRKIPQTEQFMIDYVELFRPRMETLNDVFEVGSYFFSDIDAYNEKMVRKKWKEKGKEVFNKITETSGLLDHWNADDIKKNVENQIEATGSSFGEALPLLRIATTGDVKGADIFKTMQLMGKELVMRRLKESPELFDQMTTAS